jgi:hypothetical protein
MMLVEVLGGDELEDSIAEVFKALVVAWRQVRALIGKRAMRYSLQQEAGVAKMDSDLLL